MLIQRSEISHQHLDFSEILQLHWLVTGWLTAPKVAGDQGDDVSPTLCVGGQSGEGEQRDSDVRPGTRDQRAELSWLAHTCRPKYRPRAESWAQMGCWVYSESPAPGYWHLTSVCSVQCATAAQQMSNFNQMSSLSGNPICGCWNLRRRYILQN